MRGSRPGKSLVASALLFVLVSSTSAHAQTHQDTVDIVAAAFSTFRSGDGIRYLSDNVHPTILEAVDPLQDNLRVGDSSYILCPGTSSGEGPRGYRLRISLAPLATSTSPNIEWIQIRGDTALVGLAHSCLRRPLQPDEPISFPGNGSLSHSIYQVIRREGTWVVDGRVSSIIT
jgi:hypothetical protein